jgi:hypothetical protein
MQHLTAAAIALTAKRNGIPEHLIEGLSRYVTHGYRPGHFLSAVLENDLMEAMRRGDLDSRAGLFALCSVIDNDLPAACHGSVKRVAAWIETGGTRHFDLRRGA